MRRKRSPGFHDFDLRTAAELKIVDNARATEKASARENALISAGKIALSMLKDESSKLPDATPEEQKLVKLIADRAVKYVRGDPVFTLRERTLRKRANDVLRGLAPETGSRLDLRASTDMRKINRHV